jgi:hypothetical protein
MTTWLSSPPILFFSFTRWKIQLKEPHFGTSEVIEAESQAVLNTLTEHDFQDALKKMAEALGMVHMWGMGLLLG